MSELVLLLHGGRMSLWRCSICDEWFESYWPYHDHLFRHEEEPDDE